MILWRNNILEYKSKCQRPHDCYALCNSFLSPCGVDENVGLLLSIGKSNCGFFIQDVILCTRPFSFNFRASGVNRSGFSRSCRADVAVRLICKRSEISQWATTLVQTYHSNDLNHHRHQRKCINNRSQVIHISRLK